MRAAALLRSFRTFVELRCEARWFVLRAASVGPFVELGLKLKGLDWTTSWIERRVAASGWSQRTHARSVAESRRPTARLATSRPDGQYRGVVGVLEGERLVLAASRWYPLAGKCLSRTVVQSLLHRMDGVEHEMVIGVALRGGEVAAHAWVATPDAASDERDGYQPLAPGRSFR
jgi:hypothetical protein